MEKTRTDASYVYELLIMRSHGFTDDRCLYDAAVRADAENKYQQFDTMRQLWDARYSTEQDA